MLETSDPIQKDIEYYSNLMDRAEPIIMRLEEIYHEAISEKSYISAYIVLNENNVWSYVSTEQGIELSVVIAPLFDEIKSIMNLDNVKYVVRLVKNFDSIHPHFKVSFIGESDDYYRKQEQSFIAFYLNKWTIDLHISFRERSKNRNLGDLLELDEFHKARKYTTNDLRITFLDISMRLPIRDVDIKNIQKIHPILYEKFIENGIDFKNLTYDDLMFMQLLFNKQKTKA